MSSRVLNKINRRAMGLLTLSLAAIISCASAQAQPPAPGQGGGPGRMGGGGGRMGGGRMFRGGRNALSVMMPVPALAAELKLTAKQQSQIKNIQDQFRKDMMAILPAPGGPGGPRPGGPPQGGPRPGGVNGGGPGRMGGMGGMDIQKFADLTTKADSKIEAVLTPQQKKELPGALKEIGAMRQAGIPVETLGQLQLTSSQKSKITSITDKSQKEMQAKFQAAHNDFQSLRPVMEQARAKTHADVLAVLTPAQKSVIDNYEKEHPRGRGMGGGGFGGGGFGGRGGRGGRGATGSPKI